MDKPQFLHEQAEDAQAAMRAALRDAKKDLFKTVDPRIWARSHPWQTMAAAAAAGFAASSILLKTPSRPHPDSDPADDPPEKPSRLGRLFARLLKRGFRATVAAAQPFIEGLLAAQVAAEQNAAQTADSGNGHSYADSSIPASPDNPQPPG